MENFVVKKSLIFSENSPPKISGNGKYVMGNTPKKCSKLAEKMPSLQNN